MLRVYAQTRIVTESDCAGFHSKLYNLDLTD